MINIPLPTAIVDETTENNEKADETQGFPATDLELLRGWQEVKLKLNLYKEQEKQLREKVINTFFGEDRVARKVSLPDGNKLVLTVPVRYVVDTEKYKMVEKKLPGELLNRCFKVSYSLDKREYNQITDERRIIMDECIERKPGLPTIDIK